MSNETPLAKAQLCELDTDFKNEKKGGKKIHVQFNPETLKLSYSNKSTSSGSDDKSNTEPKQFVGGGTTKLTLQLWFDVTSTASLPEGKEQVNDVRLLTSEIVYFITAQGNQKAAVPPGLRFKWGNYHFDGVVESLEESLEFFSADGRALRASMSLSLSGQKMLMPTEQSKTGSSNAGGPGAITPGTFPLAQALAGSTLQALAASAGQGTNWQAIADTNGIDNPRLLQPGKLLNLNANPPGY